MELDDLDNQILALLRQDPQVSNKHIAGLVSVSETTVASRIRSMTDRKVMRITAQRDILALGDTIIAHLDIYVEGRPVDEVCDAICSIDEVSSVILLMGSPQIIAQLHAKDGEDLLNIVERSISPIQGIAHIESIVSHSILKFRLDVADLSVS